MNKTWSDIAWEDYIYWQKQDKKTLKKIFGHISMELFLKVETEYCFEKDSLFQNFIRAFSLSSALSSPS